VASIPIEAWLLSRSAWLLSRSGVASIPIERGFYPDRACPLWITCRWLQTRSRPPFDRCGSG
jgi:hypothetical protein